MKYRHTRQWQPDEIATYDQLSANADRALSAVVDILRDQITELGEPQAVANVRTLLADDAKNDPENLVGIALTALRQLAVQDEPHNRFPFGFTMPGATS